MGSQSILRLYARPLDLASEPLWPEILHNVYVSRRPAPLF